MTETTEEKPKDRQSLGPFVFVVPQAPDPLVGPRALVFWREESAQHHAIAVIERHLNVLPAEHQDVMGSYLRINSWKEALALWEICRETNPKLPNVQWVSTVIL